MATEKQIARIKADWEKMAGEPVNVEVIDETFFGFCSELGALRIYYKYRHGNVEHIAAEYSVNLKTWFFRLEANSYLEN